MEFVSMVPPCHGALLLSSWLPTSHSFSSVFDARGDAPTEKMWHTGHKRISHRRYCHIACPEKLRQIGICQSIRQVVCQKKYMPENDMLQNHRYALGLSVLTCNSP